MYLKFTRSDKCQSSPASKRIQLIIWLLIELHLSWALKSVNLWSVPLTFLAGQ